MATPTVVAPPNIAGQPGWRLKRNGSFRVFVGEDEDVTPRGRKARAIVAYLSDNAGDRIRRDRLIELLWGDRGEAQARASLRQALLEIRLACGSMISSDGGNVWIESSTFERGKHESGLSNGELYEDLNDVTPEFDDWLRVRRAREATEEWDSLQRQVEQLLARGRGAAARPLIERMRRIDSYNDDWLRLAMQAEFQAGHPAGIEQQFNAFAQSLQQDLGVTPAAETKSLHDRLLVELSTQPSEDSPVPEAIAAAGSLVAAREPARRRSWSTLGASVAMLSALGLTQSAQTMSATPPRIAVLPFVASANVDVALAEGLSDELVSQLARHSQLRVIGRTSADQFKGKAADLRTIGRSLHADYIVEGKVAETPGGMRVMVSLVRGDDGSVSWTQQFRGTSRQLQPVQAAIGTAIGRSLGVGPAEPSRSTPNGEAFALYLKAKGLMRDRENDGLAAAIQLLQEAVRIDPQFAAGWAQLAIAANLLSQPDVMVGIGGAKPVRMTKRAAAERALKLDPQLAEAHAAMAQTSGGWGTRRSSRVHLQHALQLAPNDSQTLYWWGMAVSQTGNQPAAVEAYRRAASLDPLWKRPVQEAMTGSLHAGDRAAALRYLRTIQAGNPAAAVEVEGQFAYNVGDFSRVVQLALTNLYAPWDAGKARAVQTLIGLGFTKEGILIGQMGPFGRASFQGHIPPFPAIMDMVRYDVAGGDDLPVYALVVWGLARERRWKEVAALYDANLGLIEDVRGNDPGGSLYRVRFGPMLALSLHEVGRRKEAARLALAASRAADEIIAHGGAAPEVLVHIAAVEAVLGRKERALTLLEHAFAKNWRMDEFVVQHRIGQDPTFMTLLGNPRFERLRRIQAAHIERERRETLALGIL